MLLLAIFAGMALAPRGGRDLRRDRLSASRSGRRRSGSGWRSARSAAARHADGRRPCDGARVRRHRRRRCARIRPDRLIANLLFARRPPIRSRSAAWRPARGCGRAGELHPRPARDACGSRHRPAGPVITLQNLSASRADSAAVAPRGFAVRSACMLLAWAIIVLLILLTGLYVAAEFAAVSARRSRLAGLAEDGNGARRPAAARPRRPARARSLHRRVAGRHHALEPDPRRLRPGDARAAVWRRCWSASAALQPTRPNRPRAAVVLLS